MLLFFILFLIFSIFLSVLTTIPIFIALLIVGTVVFRKPWVFFVAFSLGLFLDLIFIRHLGYTGLVFTILVFLIRLYERKFETQTFTFVFLTTFLGSIFYLWLFGYQTVFLQAFITALSAITLFVVILSKAKDLDSSSLHSSE